jgi:hypothetical protein
VGLARYAIHLGSGARARHGAAELDDPVRRVSIVENRGAPLQQRLRHRQRRRARILIDADVSLRSLALFAMYAPRHPTIVRKARSIDGRLRPDIESGDYNFILRAGAQYAFGPVSVLAQVSRT